MGGFLLLFRTLLFSVAMFLFMPVSGYCVVASQDYVLAIVNSIKRTDNVTAESSSDELPTAPAVWVLHETVAGALSSHISDTSNPHSVTASQVGLGNVKNLDTTNASNITSGTLATARLSVGTTSGTVAAGNDVRFNSVTTTQPSGTPPTGRVWIWFEK